MLYIALVFYLKRVKLFVSMWQQCWFLVTVPGRLLTYSRAKCRALPPSDSQKHAKTFDITWKVTAVRGFWQHTWGATWYSLLWAETKVQLWPPAAVTAGWFPAKTHEVSAGLEVSGISPYFTEFSILLARQVYFTLIGAIPISTCLTSNRHFILHGLG